MTNRFLISVAAAALIAGTGFANAQGQGGGMNREGAGSSVQHSAPAPGGAAQSAPQRGDTATSEKAGASESKSMREGKQAQDTKGMKPEGREGKEKTTVGQAPAEHKGGAATTQSRDEKMGGQNDKMGRDEKMNRDDKMGQKGSAPDANRAQSNETGAGKTGSQTTTGNAATSATAAPPAEKQTQIRSSFKSDTTIKETTNVNFNVSVGAVVPASVHFYPVPTRIVEIYPEWRGYEVILVSGRYIIVRPRTHEIVYIIEG